TTLESELDAVDRLLKIGLGHDRCASSPRSQRCLVYDVREVGADHAHRALRDDLQTNRRIAFDPPHMDFENGQPPVESRPLHDDRAIEASRAEERGVQYLWAVR